MKKLFFALFVLGLLNLSACKKDSDHPEPVSAVVGKWAVQIAFIDPATGFPVEAPFVNTNFELELNVGETGWIRSIFGEKALEWDLINGDGTIVLTSQAENNQGEPVLRVETYDLKSQNPDNGIWENTQVPHYLQDTSGSFEGPYFERWLLDRL